MVWVGDATAYIHVKMHGWDILQRVHSKASCFLWCWGRPPVDALHACRALAATEARLAAAATRLQEEAGQVQRKEAEALGRQLAGLGAEHGALVEEYSAVTDDLAALVRENQVGGRR